MRLGPTWMVVLCGVQRGGCVYICVCSMQWFSSRPTSSRKQYQNTDFMFLSLFFGILDLTQRIRKLPRFISILQVVDTNYPTPQFCYQFKDLISKSILDGFDVSEAFYFELPYHLVSCSP